MRIVIHPLIHTLYDPQLCQPVAKSVPQFWVASVPNKRLVPTRQVNAPFIQARARAAQPQRWAPKVMPQFEVKIIRIVDETFPGFVECTFLDAHGHDHTILEKVPVVSSEDITAHSAFPVRGHVACEVLSQRKDEAGRILLQVDTSRPYGIESASGETKFELVEEQVVP